MTGGEVLLSVVIPTHDVAPWVRRTLESVLRQGVEPMEVIVVDDHSRDGTPHIVAEIADRDPRVQLVAATTRGGGSARNEGARRARGTYLAFCDGDDLLPDHAYEALVGSLERSGSDMAVGDYLKFRAVHTWRPTDVMPAFDRPAVATSVRREPTLLYSRPCWNRLFRRSFWVENHLAFPDVPRSNDIVPMVRAYLAAGRIDVVPDVVYVYRERPGDGSMTARAAGGTSLLSYLGQELECAHLVSEAGDDGLEAAFADLVWERDGYVAVANYLLSPALDDGIPSEAAAVSAALRSLLEVTHPRSSNSAPLRRLVVELTVAEQFVAARAVARALEFDPRVHGIDGDTVVREWSALIGALRERGLADGELKAALTERFARRIVAPVPESARAAWRSLVDEGRQLLGDRALMFSPEASQPSPHESLETLRAEIGAVVDSVHGGSRLVMAGSVRAGSDGVPGLFDGLRAAATGAAVTIAPTSIEWDDTVPGARRWRAVYPVRALPLHRPLTPVVRVGESVVSLSCAAEPPAYAPRDAFLYDRIDEVLVVRRRRHWVLRAARRAAHLAGRVPAVVRRRLIRR